MKIIKRIKNRIHVCFRNIKNIKKIKLVKRVRRLASIRRKYLLEIKDPDKYLRSKNIRLANIKLHYTKNISSSISSLVSNLKYYLMDVSILEKMLIEAESNVEFLSKL